MTREVKLNIKLHHVFWISHITYNTYVPISCDDVHDLNLINELYKKGNIVLDTDAGNDTPPSAPFFFSNHPIVWVKVVGRVSKVSVHRRDVCRISFSIADGLGAKALQCTFFSPAFPDECGLEGETVAVFGKLEWFMGFQVRVHKIMLIEHTDPVRFYLFREEILATRRFVLEKDAELFKNCVPRLQPLQIPTKSIPEVETEQLEPLRRHMRKRRRQWAFKDDPAGYYQVWPEGKSRAP